MRGFGFLWFGRVSFLLILRLKEFDFRKRKDFSVAQCVPNLGGRFIKRKSRNLNFPNQREFDTAIPINLILAIPLLHVIHRNLFNPKFVSLAVCNLPLIGLFWLRYRETLGEQEAEN